MDLHKRGMDIGKRIFGGKFLEENKVHFWLIHETRPFMRCMHQYSLCLYESGKLSLSVEILEEMLELNPNDNQGVRDFLMLYLIEIGENEKYKNYAKKYKWDNSVFSLFNAVLFSFKTKGSSEATRKKLQKATEYNPFVLKRLLSNRKITNLEDYYQPGHDSEAKYYASEAQSIWKKTQGAMEWLREQKEE